jgi:ADP-ribosyl-[dinitrogen reductase] hydrolase
MGLAIGDALGSPAEFKEPGEFEPITDMRYSGVWRIPAGYWTDDTSMAICLAESIIEHGEIRHVDILERFCRWYQLGENSSTGRCFDIGNTTRKALTAWINRGDSKGAPTDAWESGNGSIMRLAPVAVKWFRDLDMLQSAARAQSMVTHASESCLNGCEELATLLGRAIRGEDVMTELRSFANLQINGVPNTGYVVDTMIAAKWAVGATDNFDDAVLSAVNLGGDSDTIGAVAGQIAGAIYGVSSIRPSWITTLYDTNRLQNLAEMLYST